MGNRKPRRSNTFAAPEDAKLTPEQREIYEWLQGVQFRRQTFGGLDEADVWRKLEELNALYEKAFLAERERHRGLLGRDDPRSAGRKPEGDRHE